MDIKIPYLAEGVDSGTVVSILVKAGDSVKKDQIVLELETNKATAPIPSPISGTVTKILVKEGDVVSVGQTVISIEETASAKKAAAPVKPAPRVSAPLPAPPTASTGLFPPAASPSVRKMARQLDIDLTQVRGSERGGRITLEDLKAYVQRAQRAPAAGVKPAFADIDFSKWGPVTKTPISPIRKKIGEKMQDAWSRIPHVTQFDEADITELMEFRKKYSAAYEKEGIRLTLTAIILKAVVPLLQKYPVFNSSLDERAQVLVSKQYYHVGIAVDTPAGLIVPVLKEADRKNLFELSRELGRLAEKTRQRKVSLEELTGGTFTISNLGGIGGTHFTPIVNPPEVAILGIGRGVTKPAMWNQSIEPRLMLPLALSYDHRVIDGADGARFMKDLVDALEHFDEKNFKIKK